MPLKHTLKAIIRIPTKKAKISTILSGISCATSDAMHIGSMVPSMNLLKTFIFIHEDPIEDSDSNFFPSAHVLPNVVSTTGPTSGIISTATTKPSTQTISLGTFCHFCLDVWSPLRQHQYIERR
ncbi:hypothetical protein CY34DRAFT_15270 [Suillus luteus UH-Slu-Lm8-n1]|uniref:Uncharacterized protein n=1 Tax=Suillus luteus UH-Slu-Lm8-n1 TaxID=930992 RepID=A0A0D0AIY5_9AGAM|nr:hypothetical protein CY34DRAFT_15270 [Suillus luteus UH-Slu-Lm8-n1]